ncbi:hypothetical protein N9948_00855 [bacterium]|nr:hypothetical protein [bacterium]
MSSIEDKLSIVLMERMIINKLLQQTVDLIHSTQVVPAIKKLTQAHDILTLNQEIIKKYSKKNKFCWDKAAVQDLSYLGKELVVCHRIDFDPALLVYSYNDGISNLVDSLYANDRIFNS